MRESRKYLLFFKQNLLLIVIPFLISLALGIFFILNQPKLFSTTSLFEVKYNSLNIKDKTILADQIVTEARSQNTLNQLNIESEKVLVYKPSPLFVKIEVISRSSQNLDKDLQKLSNYLTKKYDLLIVGDKTYNEIKLPIFTVLFPFLAVGIGLGIITSLIKQYFKYF